MTFSTPLKPRKAKKIATATFVPLKSQRTLSDLTEDPAQKKCATVLSTPLKSESTVIDLAEDPTQEINIIEHPRWGDWWGAPNTDGDVSSRYQMEYFSTLSSGQKPEEVHVGCNSKALSVVRACQDSSQPARSVDPTPLCTSSNPKKALAAAHKEAALFQVEGLDDLAPLAATAPPGVPDLPEGDIIALGDEVGGWGYYDYYYSRQDEVLPELYFSRRRSERWRCVPRNLTGAETGGQWSSRGDRCAEEHLDAAGPK